MMNIKLSNHRSVCYSVTSVGVMSGVLGMAFSALEKMDNTKELSLV